MSVFTKLKRTASYHPMAIHAFPIGGGKFNVAKVGSKVQHVKPGDTITSSDLDDLSNAGHKVKEIKKPIKEGYIHIGPAGSKSPYTSFGSKKPGTVTLGDDSKWAKKDKEAPSSKPSKVINDRLTTKEEVELDEGNAENKMKKNTAMEELQVDQVNEISSDMAYRAADAAKTKYSDNVKYYNKNLLQPDRTGSNFQVIPGKEKEAKTLKKDFMKTYDQKNKFFDYAEIKKRKEERAARKAAMQTTQNSGMQEEVEQKEKSLGDHQKLRKYIKGGEADKSDMNDYNLAANLMQKGDVDGLKKHLRSMDTVTREHVLMHVNPEHYQALGFISPRRQFLNKMEEVEQVNEMGKKGPYRPVSSGLENLRTAQAATRGDEALDKKYGYGTTKGGVSPIAGKRREKGFGAVANFNSAQAALTAKKQGANPKGQDAAIHKGWGKTVDQMPAANPEKQAARKKLQQTPFYSLPKGEQEKDTVLRKGILNNSVFLGTSEESTISEEHPIKEVIRWHRGRDQYIVNPSSGMFMPKGKPNKEIGHPMDQTIATHKAVNVGPDQVKTVKKQHNMEELQVDQVNEGMPRGVIKDKNDLYRMSNKELAKRFPLNKYTDDRLERRARIHGLPKNHYIERRRKGMSEEVDMIDEIAVENNLEENITTLGDHFKLIKFVDQLNKDSKESEFNKGIHKYNFYRAARLIKNGNIKKLRDHLKNMETKSRDHVLKYINPEHHNSLHSSVDEALGTMANKKKASQNAAKQSADPRTKPGDTPIWLKQAIKKAKAMNNEEVEQVDEMEKSGLSTKMLSNYSVKASAATTNKSLPYKKIKNRYGGVYKVDQIMAARDKNLNK